MHNQEPIVLKAYDLLKFTLPILNTLPRNQKYIFGDRVQNHQSDLLELLLEAVYAPREAKRPILNKVNLSLEKMRFFVRLGFDMRYISHGQYKQLAERIDEIGRMTGGWLRSL